MFLLDTYIKSFMTNFEMFLFDSLYGVIAEVSLSYKVSALCFSMSLYKYRVQAAVPRRSSIIIRFTLFSSLQKHKLKKCFNA